METTRVNLHPIFFERAEKTILESGCLTASLFRYESGVCGLRIRNLSGQLVILPFQGQQIWRASFNGKELAMKSTFAEPVPTRDYLSTYGGFLIHCGATAMGVPAKEDTHPLHGELPNWPYDEAYVETGTDEKGRFIAAGGKAHYTVAFNTNYTAQPRIKLYETETVADVTMTITNLRNKPMEYMYMCHINFLPVDGSRLVYSAQADAEHIKVHNTAPPVSEALERYTAKLNADPKLHNIIDSASQVYDPEIVFTVKYTADKDGFSHCLQLMPDGDAFYVAFQQEQLPYGIRWIARTGDEDALGMALPATAEHKGYTYSKKNGDVKTIGAGKSVTFVMKAGYLGKERASEYAEKILKIT
ncbi:MAG: DUF4432 family protein [Treponema sp.]|nr:DUF4432 family protein [Treponema sp.]